MEIFEALIKLVQIIRWIWIHNSGSDLFTKIMTYTLYCPPLLLDNLPELHVNVNCLFCILSSEIQVACEVCFGCRQWNYGKDDFTAPGLDENQFAYRPKRGAEDSLLTLLHRIFEHVDKQDVYARVLFIDFSSATLVI